jgi:ABC-type antimicrobial peptide transport system permease subunit
MSLLLRTQGDPTLLVSPIRDAVWDIDPEVPISDVKTMDEAVAESMEQPRLLAKLLVLFGALALVLGAVGVYGVMSYGVGQRSTELGVRIAFGAGRGAILRQIMSEAFRLILVGLVVGVAGVVALTRLLTSQLYQIEPTDPMILASVVVTLCAVGLVASYLPGRKASRLDLLEVLRGE